MEKGKKNLKVLILSIIAAVVGVAIITVGSILLPMALNKEFTTKENVNPIATIKLSNGMKLEYEILESDCPNASTNFIYLADIGYFDGTVIFDAQSGWIRFGGWEIDGDETRHRGDSNEKFLKKVVYKNGDEILTKYDKNKFGYRLKQDTAKSYLYNSLGTLSFCYERSATEFQIATSNDPSLSIPGDVNEKGTREWKVSPFAVCKDQNTFNNIVELSKISELDENNEYFEHKYYKPPLIDGTKLIKIESVEVNYKLKSKWKNFSFYDWIYDEKNGSSRRYSWYESNKQTGIA